MLAAMRQTKCAWEKQMGRLRQGVLAGDLRAMADLGLTLQQGIQDKYGRAIVRRHPKEGFELLLRAAEGGDSLGMFGLAYAYDVGWGTEKSPEKALRWYRRDYQSTGSACAAANIAASYRDLGRFRLAYRWSYRASQLDADESVVVGYYLQYGIGVKRDKSAAGLHYRRAIRSRNVTEYGREEAMYHLAVLELDDDLRGARTKARALLNRANRDGDYPEAGALLRQLEKGAARLAICRCIRGLRKHIPGQTRCDIESHNRHRDAKATPGKTPQG